MCLQDTDWELITFWLRSYNLYLEQSDYPSDHYRSEYIKEILNKYGKIKKEKKETKPLESGSRI